MTVEGLGSTRTETFEHGTFSARILVPESSESLIDELEFEGDERLPYWAELWPAARALAKYLIDLPVLPGRAIELGSGVALPSLALLHRGVDVLATDYYETALRFARHNAELNGLPPLRTELLDWRDSPERMGRFPLITASDVLYESRNVEALAELLPLLLEPGGVILIGDPGRIYTSDFIDRMTEDGWDLQQVAQISEIASAGGDIRTNIQIYELRRD